MFQRLLLLSTMFTMLWTGTFCHDFFGSQIFPMLQRVSQSLRAEAQNLATTPSFQDSTCPCPEHEHSPWLHSTEDDPTESVSECVNLLLGLFCALLSQNKLTLPDEASARVDVYALVGVTAKLFLLHRSLLI